MATILVTGASGALGSEVLTRLVERGHVVRAVIHRNSVSAPRGVEIIEADVVTGRGLAQAGARVDAIVHAATSVRRHPRETEVRGARNLVKHASETRSHLIYPSIVGVDRIGGTYYRAKKDAEDIIAGAQSWTILRATQFHPTLAVILSRGIFPTTSHLSFQPVDVGDVADEIVSIVETGPRGRADEFGGPEVLSLRAIVAARRDAIGKRTILPRVPALGPFKALDRGDNLSPDHDRGTITWREWLDLQR